MATNVIQLPVVNDVKGCHCTQVEMEILGPKQTQRNCSVKAVAVPTDFARRKHFTHVDIEVGK